ncbi:MAG: xylulokinase [Adhaeribacter sp.]
MYLIGYDIGSSSVKATLLEIATGKAVASAFAPAKEMEIQAPREGWAEQDPDLWWNYVVATTHQVVQQAGIAGADVKAIGISYQMHGLVVVDKQQRVLRPSIIWCDSRAVAIGNKAFGELGAETCLGCFLNSPGNFTASKLRWVQENEPEIYRQIDKFMLPGDYIAMKLSGRAQTTASGLSEGILWNFQENRPAFEVMEYYGIDPELIPELVPTFGRQAEVSVEAAALLGLAPGTVIGYRAGDQPNNAFSLGVINPGEIAATAGTSGVIYGINTRFSADPASRVNTFLHVNHLAEKPSTGTLLCVNGTGILNSWLRKNLFSSEKHDIQYSYAEMNEIAAQAPPGAEGLSILPFGNGAERMLENQQVGASIQGISLITHQKSHLARAGQEGIIFALRYGFDIMKSLGIQARTVKAGDANMFLSPLFAQTFATVTDTVVELYNTDGAQGAARGAGLGAGLYPDYEACFVGLSCTRTVQPEKHLQATYEEVYQRWLRLLKQQLGGNRKQLTVNS